jgi:NADP-dependent 3-hydroxy acid dehydrogenase YdfG
MAQNNLHGKVIVITGASSGTDVSAGRRQR